ncbi:helix-turn-helix domain-containing protein [Streptomyces hesseae]|uniref:Helix-turn-helix transcriptional regulator n=1 Tax=Streptomyces hesseae TaxID=3075519 RepID=A0ABU2STU7_9ACTN|nr:helix-turn-helix transcriptional regulator [Streptomyces sp. DSM 40473]MDT0451430.1 helix-turn-helix transcriptional regulator [Streptomyces sp. DSM 40473]
MPPRTNPTARQVRLGAELRKLRECAGVAAGEAARVVGVDQGKMSLYESGRTAVSEERLRRLASHYGVPDAALVDALVAMATERRRGWWEKYRSVIAQPLLDLAEMEHHAVRLRSLQVVHMPGLLQTEAYARAVYSNNSHELLPQELDAIVDFRMKRRQILDREAPPRLDVLVHEAALRIKVGDSRVLREQIAFILETSERPGVSVRVIPFAADGFGGASYAMLYAEAAVRQLDTVQFDAVHHSVFVGEEDRLVDYRRVLTAVEGLALTPAASRDLMRCIAREA